MANPFAPAQIDFSALGNLLTNYRGGQQARREDDVRDAFSGGLPRGPNGEIDFGAAYDTLAQANPAVALQGAQRNTLTPYQQQSLEIQRQRLAQGGLNNGIFGTPIYGTDPNTGETVLGAMGRDGSFQRLDTDGVQITPGVSFQNLGTTVQPFDKRSGAPVAPPTPIDVQGEAAQKEVGKLRGEAEVDLPGALQKADQAIGLIDKMIEHPGRELSTGASGVLDPRAYYPGSAARDFQVAAKQLEGKVFLEAFESLKGGGHITEIEGQKGQEAIARLDRSQSDAEYLAALEELRGIIELGKQRAAQRVTGPTSPTAQAAPQGTTPPAPAPLAGKRLQWNGAMQLFRDEQGVLYNVNGEPVANQ